MQLKKKLPYMKLPKLPGASETPKAPSAVDDELEVTGDSMTHMIESLKFDFYRP